jgi:type II secretory pathway component PulF
VTGRAVKMIEPVIISVLAVFVAFILLSVYLPMFSMYGSIGM